MGYYTTVKVVDANDQPLKAEVTVGEAFRGFTNEDNGEIHFMLSGSDLYSGLARRLVGQAQFTIYGGKTVTVRV